ncbi:transposon-transfer assisting family protein [Clostridium sp. C105KSO13]|uniref:transposon-transfer assisting family protein n=1 Tax=Clostridium sp. C105KSO13 TaxID=1776045 RepID=UPI0007405D29|nr:transposon-transfer assisting family protein [Clostridium sp. C105KSO13]CUX33173.1 hypothetical protein BN3456_01469 [Clostridium sp. C105KSO13]
MMEIFEQDEYYIMEMFQKENRQQTISAIKNVLSYLTEDEEMFSLVDGTLQKLKRISDQEFQQLDLEIYEEEPMRETWT